MKTLMLKKLLLLIQMFLVVLLLIFFTGEEKYLKIASDAVDFLLEHAWDKEYGGNSKCVTLNEIK